MGAQKIIIGIGGVALALAGVYGAVKLVQGGHPWMGFFVGAGAGLAGVNLAGYAAGTWDPFITAMEQAREAEPALTVH
jgi:hypothetical protein